MINQLVGKTIAKVRTLTEAGATMTAERVGPVMSTEKSDGRPVKVWDRDGRCIGYVSKQVTSVGVVRASGASRAFLGRKALYLPFGWITDAPHKA